MVNKMETSMERVFLLDLIELVVLAGHLTNTNNDKRQLQSIIATRTNDNKQLSQQKTPQGQE